MELNQFRKSWVCLLRILGLALILCNFSLAEETDEAQIRRANTQTILPIDASNRNRYSYIRNYIFTDEEFVLAILPTTHIELAYHAVVISKEKSGYRCELRKVNVADAKIELFYQDISKKPIVVTSRKISDDSVRLIVDALREQVLKASYVDPGGSSDILDATHYEVYVESACALIKPAYRRRISSVDTVFNALLAHVEHPKQDRPTLLEKVERFFRDLKAGKNPRDEFPIEPPPEIILPPID